MLGTPSVEDSGEVAGLGGGGDDAECAVGADACGGGRVGLGLLFGGCGGFGGGRGGGGFAVTAAGCG